MEYPPLGLGVIAILDTDEEKIGYWDGTKWMQGVDDDPNDIEMVGNVVSWKVWE
jgi:hypothetical protein